MNQVVMKVVLGLVFISLAGSNAGIAHSQSITNTAAITYQKEQAPWAVYQSGVPFELPFLGGFNDPKPSLVDFDRDGLIDLMIGQIDGSLLYLRNAGTQSVPQWTPVQERLGGVDIGAWYTFADIDGDLDLDLFCDSRLGTVMLYRNETVGNNIAFQFIDSALTSHKFGGDSVLNVGINSTPAFADIDNDGDLDYFFGAINGGRLEFDRNEGTAFVCSLVFVTDFYDSVQAFSGGRIESSTERHGYSFINFSDFDNDEDFDLFFGDIFNLSLYLFQNDGTPDTSDLNLITTDFLGFNTRGFNHPVFADLDNDDDQDMILGVAQNANIDNLRFLRNESGLFIEETRNLISQFDLGNDSKPALADLDNDGDIDMLVGGNLGKLRYFENIGTASAPVFETDTVAFLGLNIGSYSAPALVDWDGDSDLDLLVGNVNGRIEYWRNDGNVFNFAPTLVTNQLPAFINDTLKVIKVDQLAVPYPADLNNDGLIDLVVGEWDFNGLANVLLFKNIGTLGNPVLTRLTNRLIKVLDQNGDTLNIDFTIPLLCDWNQDGKMDFIVGGRYGGLTLYINTAPLGQFPDSLTLIKSAEVIPGGDAGQYLAIALADIDNDSDKDVFVGESSGGINFYRAFSSTCCVGIRGDFNNDGMDATVLDLNYLVNDIFRGGPSAVCSEEADLNGDGNPSTILDLNYLVNDIFRGGPSPLSCP